MLTECIIITQVRCARQIEHEFFIIQMAASAKTLARRNERKRKRQNTTAMSNISGREELKNLFNTISAVLDESEKEQTLTDTTQTRLETAKAQLESNEQNLERMEQANARLQKFLEDFVNYWNEQRMRVMGEFHREWGVEGENNDGDATDGRGGEVGEGGGVGGGGGEE